jgi:6-phosphogluconate dehydrogenase (decarboxylating)
MRCLVMVPADAIAENTVQRSVALVEPGDSRIDGGDTFYKDDIYRLPHQRRVAGPRGRIAPRATSLADTLNQR